MKRVDEINARLVEIRSALEDAETKLSAEDFDGNLEEMRSEVDGLIKERNQLTAELETIENRAREAEELRGAIAGGKAGIEIRTFGNGEQGNMENVEVRNTLEYGKAFVKAIMTGDDSEARALLSGNVSGGQIPVPEMLDNEIRNAWEKCELLSLCKQTAYKGNVKVGFEYSATGAVVHVEGTPAPDEEVLALGTVELKAESIKKWITVSDEAIEGTTIDTIGYIYAEIAQKIAEKAEEILIAKIIASPATSTTTAPGVPVYTADTAAVDTITMALAELSGKAKNVVLVMNRRTEAAFKAVAKNNKFAVDPFDGVHIVHTDALPSITSASAGETYIIAGDFGYGAQVNKPNGNDISIVLDNLSLAEKDLVKIVGRQFAGISVVAPMAFVKIKKAD